MAIGLTLTYLTTKVPNFAYGSFVTIGIYTSFTLYKVDRINPYFGTPIGFLIGGFCFLAVYLRIPPIFTRRGSFLLALMIFTLSADIVILWNLHNYTEPTYYYH